MLLNADFLERDNEKDITILRGNVQIIFQQTYISCEEAVVVWPKKEVTAVGNVLLRSEKTDIEADKISYNYEKETAKIYNGIILSGQMLLQSEYADQIASNTYKAKNAYFTSCTTCPASWSFSAKEIEAKVEDYAYINNAWLNFLELPSLFFPYLVLPLKTQRQTGLLPPTIQFAGERGAAIQLPFFWAISDSQDLTVSLNYFTESGLQTLFDYRYMLSETSSGQLSYGILKDSYEDEDNPFLTDKTRWHMAYNHYLELPQDYIQKTNIYLASDLRYSDDFPQLFNFNGYPALDNRISLTKYNKDYSLSLDASYYLGLLENTIDDSKLASVHRLPEIRFSLTDRPLFGSIYWGLDSQYINLSRQGLGYDTLITPGGGDDPFYSPSGNTGVFDPNSDIIRTGQRWDTQLYAYRPFHLWDKRIEVTPFALFRQTQYVLGALNEAENFDFFPHRSYLQTGVKATTELQRVYKESGLRHSIIPEISFQDLPYLHQDNHPFFGTQDQLPFFFETQPLQDQDLATGGRGLQFDYEDRIIGRRIVNFSVSNRWMKKRVSAQGTKYDQVLFMRLSQAYDLIEAKQDNGGRPWQDIRGLVNVKWGDVESFTELFYFPYHKVANVNSRLKTNLWNKSYAELIYANYLNVPRLPANVNRDLRQESLLLSGGFDLKYVNLFGQVEYSLIRSEISRYILQLEIVPPGNCWNIASQLWQQLDANTQGQVGWDISVKFRFN